jgi:hypothetical protein
MEGDKDVVNLFNEFVKRIDIKMNSRFNIVDSKTRRNFILEPKYKIYLKAGVVANELKTAVKDKGCTLSNDAKISEIDENNWKITDDRNLYKMEYTSTQLNICTRKKENFESEKLIYSLTYIGIPLTHTLEILDIVTDNILKEHKKRDLETSEIRKVVRNSLYALHSIEETGVDAQQCQIWGDVYLRKYGNPEGTMEIIHRDGKFDKLDYENLRDNIIPEVFAGILNKEKSKILDTISKKDLESMGNELMRAILDLGIYRIHHRTLLLLTEDLAMQPPHPWVINPSKSFEYIQSDLEKADKHLKDAKSFYSVGQLPYCRNTIREFIHHVSAAVLGYLEGLNT